jgi:rubredoxin
MLRARLSRNPMAQRLTQFWTTQFSLFWTFLMDQECRIHLRGRQLWRPLANDQSMSGSAPPEFKTWLCVICGLIYSEADGWPADGIAPGTRWVDISEDWMCPDCGAGKSDFQMVEV